MCRCVELPAAEEVEVEAEQCTVAVDGQDCQQVVAAFNQALVVVFSVIIQLQFFKLREISSQNLISIFSNTNHFPPCRWS